MNQALEEFGAVVIHNVLTPEECDQANTGIWTWLDTWSQGKIKKEDPTTWLENWPFNMGNKGIVQQYKAGQQQFVWNIRQHPKVHQVFTDIWKTDDLLVSFDGINLTLPPELTQKYSEPFGDSWQHCDQLKPGFQCVQGFVNLEDTGPEDGCFVCLPGSHKAHEEFIKFFPTEFDDDWVKLDDRHRDWYARKGYRASRITCPRGGMVLWDSRTIHCNSTALTTRHKPVDEKSIRKVVYVCMTPRKLISAADLKKKQKYFREGRITNHWPHKIKVFPKMPHLYGQVGKYKPGLEYAETIFKEPVLTELGRRLAGF